MAALFIGQKVRVSWCFWPENQHLEGREGFITEVLHDEGLALYGTTFQPLTENEYGDLCGFCEGQLTPILPPLESLAETNALYEPEPAKAGA